MNPTDVVTEAIYRVVTPAAIACFTNSHWKRVYYFPNRFGALTKPKTSIADFVLGYLRVDS